MKHPRFVKHSKIAINTELSTRKSEGNNAELKIIDETLKEITLDEIPKASLTYRGAFPYLIDALNELCTLNPTFDNGERVIKGQDDLKATHYSVLLKWETLTNLATRNEPTSKDSFRREIMKIYRAAPSLYINLGNGHSLLTHPFIVRNIVTTNATSLTKKEAELFARLGIEKKIAYVDIEFFKPLFNACFPGKEKGGYIETDPAFFAMLNKTIDTMRNDSNTIKIMNRFYNPRTKQFVTKYATTYHKFILYLLAHISSNEKANSLTLQEEEIIDLLSHVDPGQLYERNGKTYIKNQFDTKLFFDKSCMIYNQMAKYGYCEHTIAVSEHCTYSYSNGKLQMTISYQRSRPRTNIESYTSNFMEGELRQNQPLQVEYKDLDTL